MLECAENPASLVTFTGVGAPGFATQGVVTGEEVAELGRQMEEALLHPGELQVLRFPEQEELQQQLASAREVIADQISTIDQLGQRPTQDQLRELMGQYSRAESDRRELEVKFGSLEAAVNSANAADPIAMAARIGQLELEKRNQAELIARLHLQNQQGNIQRSDLQQTMAAPPKRLPWTAIFKENLPSGVPLLRAVHYDAIGTMREIPVTGEVRVEPHARGGVMIILNGEKIKDGALWANGQLVAETPEPAPLEPLTLVVGEDV
jgi:hypothetical protein